MIYIHKGDDTVFGPQEKFITFIFETELDLTGWKAQFKLGGFTKVIEDISSKQFDITISHSTTVQLPLGKLNGSIVLTDNNNRIKTVINTIPFVVTKDVIEQQYETIDLTIPKSSGVDIKMRIGGRAVYSINGKTGEVILTAEDVGAIPEDYIATLATYEYVDTSIANTQAELDDTNARLNQKASIDYVDEELDLKADKTEVARKANISDIPTRVSQLVNDEGYLTEHQDISGKADIDYVDNLLTYKADKSDTYTKVEVDTIIDELTLESSAVTSVNGMTGDVVIDVPDVSVFATKGQLTTGLSTKQDKGDYALKSDIPNLDEYVKNTDYAGSTQAGVVKTTGEHGLWTSAGIIKIQKATDEQIIEKTHQFKPIVPSSLDLAVKVGVTTNTLELTDDEKTSARTWLNAVGKEDYAGDNAGVIKRSNAYGTGLYSGYLVAGESSLEQYTTRQNSYFIGKGTLENIKDDYVKRGITENQTELTADEKVSAKQWLGYAEPTDILQAIASIPQFKMVIVDTLPETGEKMTLYFVPKEGTEGDIYNEYVWIDETQAYEFLGTTAVDLTDYVKNTDYATNSKAGIVIPNSFYGCSVNSTGHIFASNKVLSDYQRMDVSGFVGKGTLENIKNNYVKEAVTANDIELTDDEKTSARTWLGAVGNTDYAGVSKAGVIKTGSHLFLLNGVLYPNTYPLTNYPNASNNVFISKGTLDNVLTQYATNETIGEVEDLLDEINGGTNLLVTKTVVTTEADYDALETKDANTLYLIEEE